MARNFFTLLAMTLFLITCGGSSGSKNDPAPESEFCGHSAENSGLNPTSGTCNPGPTPDPASCPKGQKKNAVGVCEPIEDSRICPVPKVFDPNLGRCVAPDQDQPCPSGQTRNEKGICERDGSPTETPEADFIRTHFGDVVATDGVYKLGYLRLSGLESDDNVSDRKILVKGEGCEADFSWSEDRKNGIQVTSVKDADQSCQITLEVSTKKQLLLRTKTLTVNLKKRTLSVHWDPSRAALAHGGPRSYLGTFQIESNSQFPIKNILNSATEACKLAMEYNNLYGQYKGVDQAGICRATVLFSTEDGKLSVSKEVVFAVEKAQLELSLSMGQEPAEVPYGRSYWTVAQALVTTNMAADQYQLNFVIQDSGAANSPLCKEVKGFFQGHSLALNLNRAPGGIIPDELICRFGIEVLSLAQPDLRATKFFGVKFRRARTDFKIENRTASIFNSKIPRSIATIALETEEEGVTVRQINATSSACEYLTFQTQSNPAASSQGRWTLQASGRAAMKLREQTCDLTIGLTLSNGKVLPAKSLTLQVMEPLLQLDVNARELSVWSKDDQRTLAVQLTVNPGAYDVTRRPEAVFEVQEANGNIECQQALRLTSPSVIDGQLRMTSHASENLSCAYILRASLPGQYFAQTDWPFMIHFVKRPPPTPSAVQYAFQVQTVTQALTSGLGSVDFARLSLLDSQNRSYPIKNEQLSVTFNPECRSRLDQANYNSSTQTLSLKADQNVTEALNCTAVFELRDFDPARSDEILTSKAYSFKILPKPQPKVAVYNCPPNAANYGAQIWLDLEKGLVSNASILDARTADTGMTNSIGLVMELKINTTTTTDRLKRFDICTPGVTFSCPNSIASHLKPAVEFDLDGDMVTIEAFANLDVRMLPAMSWTLSECKVFKM